MTTGGRYTPPRADLPFHRIASSQAQPIHLYILALSLPCSALHPLGLTPSHSVTTAGTPRRTHPFLSPLPLYIYLLLDPARSTLSSPMFAPFRLSNLEFNVLTYLTVSRFSHLPNDSDTVSRCVQIPVESALYRGPRRRNGSRACRVSAPLDYRYIGFLVNEKIEREKQIVRRYFRRARESLLRAIAALIYVLKRRYALSCVCLPFTVGRYSRSYA